MDEQKYDKLAKECADMRESFLRYGFNNDEALSLTMLSLSLFYTPKIDGINNKKKVQNPTIPHPSYTTHLDSLSAQINACCVQGIKT